MGNYHRQELHHFGVAVEINIVISLVLLVASVTPSVDRETQPPVESIAPGLGTVFLKAKTLVKQSDTSFHLSTSMINLATFNGFCPRVFYVRLTENNRQDFGASAFLSTLAKTAGSVRMLDPLTVMQFSTMPGSSTPTHPFKFMRATKANGGGGCNYHSAPIQVDINNEGSYVILYTPDLTQRAVVNITNQQQITEQTRFIYAAVTHVEINEQSSNPDLIMCDDSSDRNYISFHSKVRCPRELVNRAINMRGRLYVYKTEIANHREPIHLCRRRVTRKNSVYYPDTTFVDTLEHVEIPVSPEQCEKWLATKRVDANGNVSFKCTATDGEPLADAHYDEMSSDTEHKTYVTKFETSWPHWCCGLKTSEAHNCEITTGWVQTQNPYKRLTSSFGDIFAFNENTTYFVSETGTLSWPRFKSNVYCRYRLWQKLENVTRIYYPSYDSPSDDVLHYSSDASKTTFNTDLPQYVDVNKTLSTEPNLICDGDSPAVVSPDAVEYFFAGPNIIVGFVPYDMALYHESQTMPNQTTSSLLGTSSSGQRPSAVIESEVHLSVEHALDDTVSDIDVLATTVAMDWCETQKQIQSLFEEQARLNPSGILTDLLKVPISAKMVGDIFTTRHCFSVSSDRYYFLNHTSYADMDPVHRSYIDEIRMMRLLGMKDKDLRKPPSSFADDPRHAICFQRPLVVLNNTDTGKPTIAFVDSEKRIRTVLDNTVVKCDWREDNEMFYRFDNRLYYYKNHTFVNYYSDDDIRHANFILGATDGIMKDVPLIQFVDAGTNPNIERSSPVDLGRVNLYTEEELDITSNIYDVIVAVGHSIRRLDALARPASVHITRPRFSLDGLGAVIYAVATGAAMTVGAIGGAVAGFASAVFSPFTSTIFIIIGVALGVCVLAAIAYLYYKHTSGVNHNYDASNRVIYTTGIDDVEKPPSYGERFTTNGKTDAFGKIRNRGKKLTFGSRSGKPNV